METYVLRVTPGRLPLNLARSNFTLPHGPQTHKRRCAKTSQESAKPSPTALLDGRGCVNVRDAVAR